MLLLPVCVRPESLAAVVARLRTLTASDASMMSDMDRVEPDPDAADGVRDTLNSGTFRLLTIAMSLLLHHDL